MKDWSRLVEEIFIHGKFMHWATGMSDEVSKLTFVLGFHDESKTWSVDIKSFGSGTNHLFGAGTTVYDAWLDALKNVIKDKERKCKQDESYLKRQTKEHAALCAEIAEMNEACAKWENP